MVLNTKRLILRLEDLKVLDEVSFKIKVLIPQYNNETLLNKKSYEIIIRVIIKITTISILPNTH